MQDINGNKLNVGDIMITSTGIAYIIKDDTGYGLKSPGSEAVDYIEPSEIENYLKIGDIKNDPELVDKEEEELNKIKSKKS